MHNKLHKVAKYWSSIIRTFGISEQLKSIFSSPCSDNRGCTVLTITFKVIKKLAKICPYLAKIADWQDVGPISEITEIIGRYCFQHQTLLWSPYLAAYGIYFMINKICLNLPKYGILWRHRRIILKNKWLQNWFLLSKLKSKSDFFIFGI